MCDCNRFKIVENIYIYVYKYTFKNFYFRQNKTIDFDTHAYVYVCVYLCTYVYECIYGCMCEVDEKPTLSENRIYHQTTKIFFVCKIMCLVSSILS